MTDRSGTTSVRKPAPVAEPDQGTPAEPTAARQFFTGEATIAALVVLAVLALAAIVAPWLFGSPTEIAPEQRLLPPSAGHPFGTDELGRDLLSRIAYGGRLSLMISIGSTVVAIVVGSLWGFFAAARKGWLDEVLMRIAEAALAIPMILFALVFVAAFGASRISLIIVAGLLMVPLTARVARAAVLSELESEYVHALRAVGVHPVRLMSREVLPNVVPALVAQASLNIAVALMLETTLSFVGLGIQPPDASWGTLLQQGYNKLFLSIWYPIIPAVVLIIAVAAFNTLGDQLNRVLNRRAK